MIKFYWWFVCNSLYLVGHLVSLIMHYGDKYSGLFSNLYPAYNWLMAKSVEINDKHGFNVWQPWDGDNETS